MDTNNESLEEEEKDELAGLSNGPPPGKGMSYSHQLRSSTTTHHKKRNQIRKHSLDEDIRIPKQNYYTSDSDEDGIYPNSTTGGTSTSSTPPTTTTTTTTVGGHGGGSSGFEIKDYDAMNKKMDEFRISDGSSGGGGGGSGQPLPEFMGTGGGVGVYKVPTRAAVHPSRPHALELRPHPLRETQVGKFLRTIACTKTQLWAGQETGVRVWNFADAYLPGAGIGGKVRRGDEDAAPFIESANTPPTICLMVDAGSKCVWSGHKDGKIRSWKMKHTNSEDSSQFKEGLSWQAHRGPVLSVIISSYGDIWSGGEGGVIKVWPWESVEKSLSLSAEEKHMAALLVERSNIDLRSLVTVNGVCNISASDVKCLLSDNSRSRVWVAGALSFSLWDARTRELLKVFNIDGQIETRADMSAAHDQTSEDEGNVKSDKKSKKEKSQGSFLQRSRNAILGAADAVRRVATKGAGAFAEETKKTEALVLSGDGTIWSGCSNGLLVHWDGNGNCLQEFHHHHCAVLCFCPHGSRMWVGYVSGMVQILDFEGILIASWIAHNGPVIKMAASDTHIFSMATHGGIRGWSVASCGPLDAIIRPELAARENLYTHQENIRILIGTWNVAQGRASQEALHTWLGSAVSDVGIVVVGCQEVEMGAGFLAMSAAKETVGMEGSSQGQWWQDAIGKALSEGKTFERVGTRQLGPLLIGIWVRKSLRVHVGDLDVAAVACGLGRAIGNKGGVGLRLRVYDRIMCFVNCHFAAHLEAVNKRNADFEHIYRTMAFPKASPLSNTSATVSSNAQTLRGQNATAMNPEDGKPELADADLVVFCGDFNYRLFGISYDEARDFVSQRTFDWLREKDQLRAEMKSGKVFQGMREAIIRFPPTYKFEKGKPGLGGYDSGEKKRIPAWCDRILYRDNRVSAQQECSLACPVVCSILQYEALMEVVESDHKPVRCKLNLEIAHVDRSVRRQEFGKILASNEQVKACLADLRATPDIFLSASRINLQSQDTYKMRITNRNGKDNAFFYFCCEGQTVKDDDQSSEFRTRGSKGFPRWLEITPSAGMIRPNEVIEVSVHHEESHTLGELVDGVHGNWWSDDTRDKEATLFVHVRGNCSTEEKTYRLLVCYRISNIPSGSRTPH